MYKTMTRGTPKKSNPFSRKKKTKKQETNNNSYLCNDNNKVPFWEARATIVKERGEGGTIRDKAGRPPLYNKSEELWRAACEYFQWCADNPLYEERMAGNGSVRRIEKMRVMLQDGLCLFLGISQDTYRRYSKMPEFCEVSTHIGDIIRTQKFTGATSGHFNHAIIARDLGLADKTELSGPGGGAINVQNVVKYEDLTDEELTAMCAIVDKREEGE